jgi:hypothetical protein
MANASCSIIQSFHLRNLQCPKVRQRCRLQQIFAVKRLLPVQRQIAQLLQAGKVPAPRLLLRLILANQL